MTETTTEELRQRLREAKKTIADEPATLARSLAVAKATRYSPK
jgi:hypothetical protein